ncbi:MAG: 7-cyano-7-deazaguanine synthase, partial [Opitutales bacterium]|nr:7-cyano-7-deazaguanine synthase [Opitutales bacterium]
MPLGSVKHPKSVVAVYSGGIDSTVMLYSMRELGIDIRGALSVDYGQKHRKEIEVAAGVCQSLGIEHYVANLSGISGLFGHSSLVDAKFAVSERHYEEEAMKSTVV